ncbi:MAG: aminomethyl-transferring glycine dehydrogenase subunit GcvPA, partial [Candidatus Omnitrophica bacterium]|nr:aminomethyl-transferring glycine dehydrogenase subunit GcvPA [Candidatus Omnitrophota bacterium]
MPYILNTDEDLRKMLKVVGVSSIDKLYSSIPSRIRLDNLLNIPKGCSEQEVRKVVKGLSEQNTTVNKLNSFLGAGCYDHYIPAALSFILSRSQFVTAYTPYQAECSQGILQTIYEYQSFLCLLTGMDVSNASMLDGASSFAEAVLMSLRITKRRKIILAGVIHPEYRKTLYTYLAGFDFIIEEVSLRGNGLVNREVLERTLDEDTAVCAFSSPNFFGLIENAEDLAAIASAKGALTVMITNPLSLALFKEPGSLGMDIVCGDGQPLGGSLGLGGSSFGFLTARKDYLRQMPGRIVGKTKDSEGKDAFCLTLQTREQHIRREKATSNICSNQSLCAITAAIYLSLVGREGLKEAALYSFNNTQYFYRRLKQVRGVKIPYPPQVFNEFVWETEDARRVKDELYKRNIIIGYYLGDKFSQHKDGILSCCTEKKSKEDIDN